MKKGETNLILFAFINTKKILDEKSKQLEWMSKRSLVLLWCLSTSGIAFADTMCSVAKIICAQSITVSKIFNATIWSTILLGVKRHLSLVIDTICQISQCNKNLENTHLSVIVADTKVSI